MRQHPLDGEYTAHGHALTVSVSPCSWLYQNYGLQIQYTSPRSCGYLNNKTKTIKNATREDVQALLDSLTPEPCKVCKHQHLFNHHSNRKHTCEVCFLTKLNAEFDQLDAQDHQEQITQDSKMRLQGATHRVSAWVHPPHGDDCQIDMYFTGEPNPATIKRELRKRKSRRTDDYTVVDLYHDTDR